MARRATGTITKRGQNRYLIGVSIGQTIDGIRKRHYETIIGTKTDAQTAITALQNRVNAGSLRILGNETVAQYLERWLKDTVTPRSQPRTVQGYRQHVTSWLTPTFGDMKLSELSAAHVKRLMVKVVEKGRTSNTANHIYTTLRLALKDAIREGTLLINACDGVDRPRVYRQTVNPPSVAGANAILAEAAKTPYGPMFEFAARTGARRGEFTALRWENVNLDTGVVSIIESAVRVKGLGQKVNPTKTATSRRGISLDSATVMMLRNHRSAQNKYIIAHHDVYTDSGYVFAGPKGTMFDLDRTSQTFKRIAIRAGYPDIHLHSMRHFHATALISIGAHPRVVSERLGHASTAFTLSTYGHLSAGLQEQAAEKVAELMNNG